RLVLDLDAEVAEVALLLGREDVADAANRVQEPGLAVVVDLAPQVAHVDLDEVAFAFEPEPPTRDREPSSASPRALRCASGIRGAGLRARSGRRRDRLGWRDGFPGRIGDRQRRARGPAARRGGGAARRPAP